MGFWVFYVDILGWLVLFGVVFLFIFCLVVKKVISGQLGGLQNFVEVMVEFVDISVKDIFYGWNLLIVFLVLIVFVWIFLFNLIDLVLVDYLLMLVVKIIGDEYLFFCVVVIIDLNVIFGLLILVFVLIVFYSIKVKGIGGFFGELILYFFSSKNIVVQILLILVNFLFEFVILIVKLVLLVLCLFGNMYVGELIFILIVVMFGSGMFLLSVLGVVLNWVWVVFYILIIILQVFIFMMLIIVYLLMVYEDNY